MRTIFTRMDTLVTAASTMWIGIPAGESPRTPTIVATYVTYTQTAKLITGGFALRGPATATMRAMWTMVATSTSATI